MFDKLKIGKQPAAAATAAKPASPPPGAAAVAKPASQPPGAAAVAKPASPPPAAAVAAKPVSQPPAAASAKPASPPQTALAAAEPASVQFMNPETRAALSLEIRFLLRNMFNAKQFPYLALLAEIASSNAARTEIPISALQGLAREIESIRDKLQPKSPLLKLADSVRNVRGMDLVVAGAGKGTPAPAPAAALRPQAAAARAAPAAAAPAAPAAPEPPEPTHVSAAAKQQILKTAAENVDVGYLSTSELGEPEMAAYFKYCLSLGDYTSIINSLRPRAAEEGRVWIWSLLVAAMRLSKHPDFSIIVGEYHVWMEAYHPEALNLGLDGDDKRKFNNDIVAEIEARELSGR